MNKNETKALAIYDRNKEYVENNNLSLNELRKFASQQDQLYVYAHKRTDKYYFNQG